MVHQVASHHLHTITAVSARWCRAIPLSEPIVVLTEFIVVIYTTTSIIVVAPGAASLHRDHLTIGAHCDLLVTSFAITLLLTCAHVVLLRWHALIRLCHLLQVIKVVEVGHMLLLLLCSCCAVQAVKLSLSIQTLSRKSIFMLLELLRRPQLVALRVGHVELSVLRLQL